MSAMPHILFLHGFLSGARAWDAVRAELAGEAETWAADLPAYGRARHLAVSGSLDETVEALVPLVRCSGITHVVGHSMGAIVALALAHRLPGAIRGAGVVGLPVFASGDDCATWLQRSDPFRARLLRRAGLAHAACSVAGRTFPAWRPVAALVARRHPVGHGVDIFDHASCGHGPALASIVLSGQVPSLATAVRVPVAAIHGEADRTAPPGPARAIATEAGWPLHVVPRGGHQLPVTHPRAVARWVRDQVVAAGVDAVLATAPQSGHAHH
jgi:pimeloyl-ACP methyl ester carboxylesterase